MVDLPVIDIPKDPFLRALAAAGDEYDAAEKGLVEAGAEALPLLARHLGDADPVAQLLAAELATFIGDSAGLRHRAFRYLDAAAGYFEGTMVPPRADMIGPDLAERFGPEPAVYLALRLLKSAGWPRWKGSSVLAYLRIVRVPETTAILIRFVLETDNQVWRQSALFALQVIADPELDAKLDAEKEWREAMRLPFAWPAG